MFVYNPLHRHGELFRLYSAAAAAPAAAPDGELLALYRPFAVRRRPPGVTVPPELAEDDRPLARRFRGLLGALSERDVAVAFPALALADARCVDLDGRHAVFVTAAMLDAIELFAATVALCARLNELALPTLAELERRPPAQVALAWLTMGGDTFPGSTVAQLLERRLADEELPGRLAAEQRWAAPPLRPPLACYRLSYLLMQLMMRAIRRSARNGWGGAHRYPRTAAGEPLPLDAGYLATLALTFVVLHETGHLELGHNDLDAPGAGASFELAADVFAVSAVAAELREPVLEAASLWCAALERTHAVAGERAADLAAMQIDPDAHPSFAVRVWNLNGRLSEGRRRGEVARLIADLAEAGAHELLEAEDEPARELRLFRVLWDLACALSAGGGPEWERLAAGEPDPPAPDGPLQRGLRAWDEGRLADAEREFRIVAADPDPAACARGHGLLGRMLEERGDLPGAEAEYRAGDAGGDGDAANDLGVLLQDRGDERAAEAAFRRADERGNAPGAYNLACLHEARGEPDAAVAAWERADARGHARAPLHLGVLFFQRGELDRAEAALQRAEERGTQDAATHLGTLLYSRGDRRRAEAAWRRGSDRGELDAMHNLGVLYEQDGDIAAAYEAFALAVRRGRDRSAGNLAAAAAAGRAAADRAAALEARAHAGDAGASYELALLDSRMGAQDSALAEFERAERLGHPHAANEIGFILDARGDAAGAEAAYRRGAERGHGRAAHNLGVALHERGDEDGALAAWRAGDELGDALAAANLGSALELTGDLAGARAAFARAEARGDTLATVHLGRLAEQAGDEAGAEAAYRHADAAGDPHGAAKLGELLRRRGDRAGAEAAWRRADARGQRDAAYNLGLLLRAAGNLDGAEAALRRAAQDGHPDARRELAFVLSARGHDRDAAQALMARVGAP